MEEALVLPMIVGSLMPTIVSVIKQADWSAAQKKLLALVTCVTAALAAYFLQEGGWVGWEELVLDFGVIYGTAQVTYLSFWKGNIVDRALTEKFAKGAHEA